MDDVIAVGREVVHQGGRRVMRRIGVVEIPANDRRHRPSCPMAALLLSQPGGQEIELHQPAGARVELQVQVDERHAMAVDVDLGIQKPLLPHPPLAEDHRLGLDQGMTREQRVAIAEIEQARAPVVDPEGRVGKVRMHPQVVQVIEIARPPGVLVDLLQRHHVRRQFGQQRGDLAQVPGRGRC